MDSWSIMGIVILNVATNHGTSFLFSAAAAENECLNKWNLLPSLGTRLLLVFIGAGQRKDNHIRLPHLAICSLNNFVHAPALLSSDLIKKKKDIQKEREIVHQPLLQMYQSLLLIKLSSFFLSLKKIKSWLLQDKIFMPFQWKCYFKSFHQMIIKDRWRKHNNKIHGLTSHQDRGSFVLIAQNNILQQLKNELYHEISKEN